VLEPEAPASAVAPRRTPRLEATRRIAGPNSPYHARVLVLTTFVAAGEAMLAPSIKRRLIGSFVAKAPPEVRARPSLDQLTERELEVLKLVARGLSNAQIAETLVLGRQPSRRTSPACSISLTSRTASRPPSSRMNPAWWSWARGRSGRRDRARRGGTECRRRTAAQ
jgi:hypothetical protein